MQCLDDVYKKIDDKNIELFTRCLKSCDAVTVEVNKEYGIFIDQTQLKDKSDEFMALAHEYGHCATGTTHKLSSPCQSIDQHEYRANRAAVHELLPYEKLMKAVAYDSSSIWSIAEYLNMPEKFVKMAIEVYKRDGYYN